MPVDYSLPAYLHPQDSVGPYTQGVGLGVQIAQARNRMAAESERLAQEAAMQQTALEVKRAELERKAIRDQQEVEMQRQRVQIMQGLKQDELAQNQQKLALAAQKAAARSAAQAQYNQMVTGGTDPAKALLQLGPELGISMAGMAQVYRAAQPKPELPDASVENMGGQPFIKVPRPNGGFTYKQIHVPKTAGEMPSSVQAIPFLGLDGKPIPGMVVAPNGNGGFTVRNVPDRGLRMAQTRVASMEKDPLFGKYLVTDREPTIREDEKKDDFQKRLATFRKMKADYDKAKAIVNGAIDQMDPSGSTTAPYPEKTVLRKKDGSRWIVLNGRAVPYPADNQVTVSPPHDEEESDPEAENPDSEEEEQDF